MNGIIRSVVLVFLLTVVFFLPGAYGQGGATGAISGSVTDVSGGSVPNADVQIISTATDQLVRHLTTGPEGTFLVDTASSRNLFCGGE